MGETLSVEVILWSVIDSVLIFAILCGNILTICAIKLSRRISTLISNQFIFSLALSDLMVGLTIPYHLAFFIGETLGKQKFTCILRFVLIILACSSSIYNLLAIATDRYIAILHPLRYNRYMTKKVALIMIGVGWIIALSIAIVPIYWNIWEEGNKCSPEHVLTEMYVNYIITPMFVSIWIAMSCVYFRIWREAVGHAKRLRNVISYQHGPNLNDSKSVQVVLLILGCFSICWMPYFVIITYIRVSGNSDLALVYESAFTMAVTNSCMNPIIYAWKNTNFRKAFWCLLRCKSPSNLSCKRSFITNHVPSSKKNSYTNGAMACNGNEIAHIDSDLEMKMSNIINCLKEENSDGTVSTGVNSLPR